MKKLALLLFLSAALPATAADTTPQITDIGGDANGLTFPYAPGGVVGNLQRSLFPEDPLGPGTATPVSVAEADILSVSLQTTYVSIPIGEDGIDHVATGIRATIGSSASPVGGDATISYEIGTMVPGGTGCRMTIYAVFPGQVSTGATTPRAGANIGGTADGCPLGIVDSFPGQVGLSVTSNPTRIVIDVPRTAFPEDALWYVDEGLLLHKPNAWTHGQALVPRIDATSFGPDFVLGQDMPEDVPCTKGCPEA